MSPRLRRGPRGAASVEMALSMIVLIPIFLYSIFLDDLLRYSLDAQEAALSTVWDYTTQDYTQPLKPNRTGSGGTQIQYFSRLTFCDHESGLDRTDKKGSDGSYLDCSDPDHHKAVVAHVCWMNNNAKQVTCEEPEKGAGGGMEPRYLMYRGQYTNGGLVKCSARAVVENYMLPETFLPQFGKEPKLVKKNWKGEGDVHGNAEAGTGGKDGNAYFLKQQQMSIITDTWALTKEADTEPGDKSGELHDRVSSAYRTSVKYLSMAEAYATFSQRITQDLLSPLALVMGDSPLSPNLAIKPHDGRTPTPSISIKQEGRGGRGANYFTTEWKDWDSNKSESIYKHGQRGEWYLGCKDAEKC
ncbi:MULTISPECIES: hypothetical protein [Corallococcus]|uniref:hypothetical protein n=1 Tax=Corallococcus TaxID=83461 RepID=UPI00117C099F|nr:MULTISPECIES: hypothetical protein [Corallococcus]NBD07621.1 hypothetical protein [Corallococcus silvisoli]TSC33623.1 hypothetical protein FOF48_00785 [Corallococcus sp. Z5C101001]